MRQTLDRDYKLADFFFGDFFSDGGADSFELGVVDGHEVDDAVNVIALLQPNVQVQFLCLDLFSDLLGRLFDFEQVTD